MKVLVIFADFATSQSDLAIIRSFRRCAKFDQLRGLRSGRRAIGPYESSMGDSDICDSVHLSVWERAAAKSAPGGKVDALNWVTPEGLTVKPLYTAADLKGLPHTDTL